MSRPSTGIPAHFFQHRVSTEFSPPLQNKKQSYKRLFSCNHIHPPIYFDEKVYYSQYKSYYSNKFHYSTGYPLHRFGSNIYFNPPFNDTIFEVNKNSFKAKYAFNIAGGNHLHIDETTTDDDFREQMRNIDYFNSHFIDLKDVAVFHYMSNVDYLTWGVYVKSEDRTYENNGKCNKLSRN